MIKKIIKSVKVIVGLAVAIPMACILLGSGFQNSPSGDNSAITPADKPVIIPKDNTIVEARPAPDYQEAMGLKSEAEKDAKVGKWDNAINQYKSVLDKLQVIRKEFPEWETAKLDEEYLVCQERADLLAATVLSISALGYYEKREYDNAFAAYTQIVEKYGEKFKSYPLVAGAWSHLGHINRIKNNYEEALKDYDIVLAQYSGAQFQHIITNSQVGEAAVYQMMGKYDEADKLLQKAMADNPSFAENFQIVLEVLPVKSWGELGGTFSIIYEFLSTTMSEEEFRRSIIQAKPSLENDVFAFIGLRFQLRGKIDEAKNYYQKCMNNSSKKGSVGYKLAIAALRKLGS
ncbi:MAG: tetratricopeptide repeat protein [Candidatus Omnitrophota bacterium]